MPDHDFFSGLDIADISLLSVRFSVKPDLEPGERTLGISLGHDVRLDPDDGSHIMLVLNIGVNAGEPEAFDERGFVFEASVSGVFGTADLDASDERKLFVLVNGLSLLYGEIRSYLIQLSSGSRLGKVLLPSVNILSYLKALETARGECDEPVAESDGEVD
jgi:preprotein translocase subunit SecB